MQWKKGKDFIYSACGRYTICQTPEGYRAFAAPAPGDKKDVYGLLYPVGIWSGENAKEGARACSEFEKTRTPLWFAERTLRGIDIKNRRTYDVPAADEAASLPEGEGL